ncbi:unnamed protein product [Protopolystoma xenopodis]|uniref:Uncharacterized protein n=1 Tax=Protopolystoma xenopodis TaxID=117903 RepID=A0A3S5FDJ4_9PLAT|nr:unnamed protein product [Protopolystoma xenopodis]
MIIARPTHHSIFRVSSILWQRLPTLASLTPLPIVTDNSQPTCSVALPQFRLPSPQTRPLWLSGTTQPVSPSSTKWAKNRLFASPIASPGHGNGLGDTLNFVTQRSLSSMSAGQRLSRSFPLIGHRTSFLLRSDDLQPLVKL